MALAVAAAAVAVWLLWPGNIHFDWRLFHASIARLEWRWIGLSLVFLIASYYGRALRWAVMMRAVKPRPSLMNLFSATLVGFTAVTLLGRPGEIVRPYLISAKEQVPLSSQFAAWLMERIYDLLVVLLLFGFALGRVRHSGAKVGSALAWVFATGGWFVGVLSAVLLLLLIVMRKFSGAMQTRLLDALRFLPPHRFEKAEKLVQAFVAGGEGTRGPSALALVIGYTVLEWAIIIGCVFCVLRAFGGTFRFGLVDVMIFLGFVSFGTLVQIPGIGGGMQVVSVVVLTELFRVPFAAAAGMALVLWIMSFVVVVPIGLALALHDGLNWHKLKGLRREVGT